MLKALPIIMIFLALLGCSSYPYGGGHLEYSIQKRINFVKNTTKTIDENGVAKIVLKKSLFVRVNMIGIGVNEMILSPGASYSGPDFRGGEGGGPNKIPDNIDDMISGGATFVWGAK